MPATIGVPDIIEQITDEHEQWGDLLRSLEPEDWGRDSACAGWTIKHVVAHVVSGLEFYRDSLENAIVGEAEPLWPDPAAGRRALFERHLAQEDTALIDAFDDAATLLEKTLMKVSDDDAQLPAWHPSGIWTVDRMLRARLSDSTIHRWDIRRGLEPHPTIDDERAAFLVDYVAGGISRYVDASACAAGARSWRFNLTQPIDAPLTIRCADGAVTADRTGEGDSDFTCTADPTTFVLVMLKRVPLDEALATGSIRDVSDTAQLTEFLAHVRSI